MKPAFILILSFFYYSSTYSQKIKIETTESYIIFKNIKSSPLSIHGLIGPQLNIGNIIYDIENNIIIENYDNGNQVKYFIKKIISKEDNKDVSRITFEVIYTSDKIAESGVLKLSMYTNVSKVENVDVLLFETEFLITVIRGKNAILFKP